ncbi:MAG: hypothetical protein EXR80_09360 [Methylococcales bacterium]|nr:hypothetical protein [Methylococcales bacterium]
MFWLCIAILFAIPLEVFHLLLAILHTLFEWTEGTLDFIIEIIFDTTVHNTQIVVFYILIAAIFYSLYRLWRGFTTFYSKKKQNLHTLFLAEIEVILLYWQESVINKIKLLSVVIGLILLFFI